jgi:hypothetical protein
MKFNLFCEESGDKAFPIRNGSSKSYIITLLLVPEETKDNLRENINHSRRNILRLRKALEWKNLDTKTKNNDILLTQFFKSINLRSYKTLFSTLIVNKTELDVNAGGLTKPNIFMNYLYSFLFKRVNPFLHKFSSEAQFFVDRNTDPISHKELAQYLCDILPVIQNLDSKYGRPIFINTQDDPCLQLSDFLSGYTRRAFEHYLDLQYPKCQRCANKQIDCLKNCESDFIYKESWFNLKGWYSVRANKEGKTWNWNGSLYFPYKEVSKHSCLIQTK